MDLTQRSVQGVLQRLLDRLGCPRAAGQSLPGLAAAAAAALARVAGAVVLLVDEVDLLVGRGGGRAAAAARSLETLFSLPRLPGAPALAIVAIANAVDLLERSAVLMPRFNCGSLLFETYSRQQLKNIVTSRVTAVDGGEAALKAFGPVKFELRVAQVAKESGDCRQVLSLIEEALLEAKTSRDVGSRSTTEATAVPTVQTAAEESALATTMTRARPVQSNQNDPLQAIQQLPLEQQILLAALATSGQQATKVSDVCSRYKELSRSLHQPINLGSKSQVSSALSALEQRGLLELRVPHAAARGRGQARGEACVELAVSCGALRERVEGAAPALKRFMA